MKYIGPFLRINTLKKHNIDNQMFYIAKESLKNICLESHCGISITPREFTKSYNNIDINTIKKFFPLLCVYKKASVKLVNIDDSLEWNEDKFRKEISIYGNSLMTLSLLELVTYYSKFKDIDKKKYALYDVYLHLAQKQLEFYASNLRNPEGVFIDKTQISDSLINEYKFEPIENKFKYSNQALLMCAFYKYSLYDDSKIGIEYRNFSTDILNMLLEFKDEIYELSINELLKLNIALNIYYNYSNDMQVKPLMLDIGDLISEKKHSLSYNTRNAIENECMLYMDYMLMYKNTNIMKFKEDAEKIYSKLIKLYDENLRIFIKNNSDRKIKYYCNEIVLYLYVLFIHSDLYDDKSVERTLAEVYKNQIINSGLIQSWPDSPSLNDIERYNNFTKKSEKLIDDINFRMPTLPTPKNNEIAPIFTKHIMLNKKNGVFKQDSTTFDSNRNMLIYYLSIYYHNHNQKDSI